jgi:hypothetical protein
VIASKYLVEWNTKTFGSPGCTVYKGLAVLGDNAENLVVENNIKNYQGNYVSTYLRSVTRTVEDDNTIP